MRCTVETDRPDTPSPSSACSNVSRETALFQASSSPHRRFLSSPILRGAPQRGSSSRPSRRCAAKTLAPSQKVIREARSRRQWRNCSNHLPPEGQSRRASHQHALSYDAARASNSLRSLSLRTIFTAAGPVIAASNHADAEGIRTCNKCLQNFRDRTLGCRCRRGLRPAR